MAFSTRQQINLTPEERTRLERIATLPSTPQKLVRRSRIILSLGSGHGLMATVRSVRCSKVTVWRWWQRFLDERVDGLLYDASRPPGRKTAPDQVEKLIKLVQSPPPPHASYWTLRALADRLDMVISTVFNILKEHKLSPHQVRTFKVSRDPDFENKLTDVVGLYVNPPDHAVVLSVDEKTQIQALGRTQTPLPMKAGQPATRSHDYKRNGTTCLLAALDIATGTVIGQTTTRHRSKEFIAFLDQIAAGLADGVKVHVILDNVSSHKSAEVHAWLVNHPDWTFHFTPTSASWTNSVEGFFSKLTRQRLKNSIFNSLEECVKAIETYIDHHNANSAKPFRWTRDSKELVESWKRGYHMIESMH